MPAEASAEWIIAELHAEADLQGHPLRAEEDRLLRTQILEMRDEDRAAFIALNNRCVDLARAAMERSKARGAITVKARRGLVVPADWFHHYNSIYDLHLPWALSGVMQNCMLANPFSGERKPWKSK